MKKLCTLLIAVIIFLQFPSISMFSSCTAESTVIFQPTLAGSVPLTASEWFASSLNRGLVATLIGMDFTNSQNSQAENTRLEIDWDSGAYVAKTKDSTILLYVLFRLKSNQILMINYLTLNEGSAWYGLLSGSIKNAGSFKFYAENILRTYGCQYYAITNEQIAESWELANDLVE